MENDKKNEAIIKRSLYFLIIENVRLVEQHIEFFCGRRHASSVITDHRFYLAT
jgi:hypothetical protein